MNVIKKTEKNATINPENLTKFLHAPHPSLSLLPPHSLHTTYWDGIRLINSKGLESQTADLLSMKAEFWDKPTAPVDTRVTHNITIPPRHQKVIEVLAERPEGARKGYLNPNFAQTGKLHTSPGLVQFDEKTGLAKILVANLSTTPQTLTPKKPIGQTMWCTSQDAAETDIVSLSKRSFHACDASHLNRGPDK